MRRILLPILAILGYCLFSVASFAQIQSTTSFLNWWYAFLNNSRLQKYESYTSSYGGGGTSSEKYYDLCSNGQYRMYSQYYSSLGGSSEEREIGTWSLSQNS